MENQEPKKTRHSRRKKQVEVVVDAPTIDSSELEARGFERTRSHNSKGHFVKDDPSTPENEAFEWVRPIDPAPEVEVAKEEPVKAVESQDSVVEVVETPIVNPPPQPTPIPEPEIKPWKKPVRPMRQRKPDGNQRGVRRSRR